MNIDTFPHKSIQNIGILGYIFTILKGSNREVTLLYAYTENGKERIKGDFAVTISKGAFILTGYSESRKKRIPLVCTKWRKHEKDKEAAEFKKALFGDFSLPEADKFTDTQKNSYEYVKPTYNQALGAMMGSIKSSDLNGRQLLEISLK